MNYTPLFLLEVLKITFFFPVQGSKIIFYNGIWTVSTTGLFYFLDAQGLKFVFSLSAISALLLRLVNDFL